MLYRAHSTVRIMDLAALIRGNGMHLSDLLDVDERKKSQLYDPINSFIYEAGIKSSISTTHAKFQVYHSIIQMANCYLSTNDSLKCDIL